MIKLSENLELIKYIVYQREILNNILEDGAIIGECLNTLFTNGAWLEYHEEDIVGAIHLVPCAKYTFEFHFYVLPPKKEAKYRMMKEFLNYVYSKEIIEKLNVQVPACYQNIMHCVIKSGFIQEGIDRESFKKNGILHDRYRFGLTKKEIREKLCQI